MGDDIETLILWIQIFTVLGAICATTVPVMYSFYPWRTKKLGRLFMFKATCYAIAIDVTALLIIFQPQNILFLFIINIVIRILIIVSTSAFAAHMWRLSHPKKEGKHRAI